MTAARASAPAGPGGRRAASRLTVFGVVQGVGFRPSVYRLARRLGLDGWVRNAGSGVEIHIEGPGSAVRGFPAALRSGLPPLASIERLDVRPARPEGRRGFDILSTREAAGFVFISPDIATCPDCLEEIGTPGARRFHYAFTNCTNCGPRYTIVRDLPYDRPRTTMAGFPLCPDCRREYEDPLDRRHHAQPIACPVCGPRLTLLDARTGRRLPGGIPEAADLIRDGRILAVKGLGGFHLVCDPFNGRAVARLRRIKQRRSKPLALMARDLAVVRRYAVVSPAERDLLLSPRRPIVLLRKKADIPLIAPGLDEIGFMLPYTPLHHLLLEPLGLIVATSSNAKDAPIAKDETEGVRGLCQTVLTHDRPIAMRADDSVVKSVRGRPLFVRRARGYVPAPQPVPAALRSDLVLIALGGELKDTVSLYKNGYVVTSQFLGDLDDYRNFGYFEETLAHLLRLFDARPAAVVSDLHPDFRTTRHAARMGLPHYRVQHHFAHVLAPLLEHGHAPGRRVLGVALDGYGYGEDGAAWGGEFLLADYDGYERFASFETVPLPGGDLAAREPWRMALAWLDRAFDGDVPDLPALRRVDRRRRQAVLGMIRSGLRSPQASSCGRLFDAVAFIAGAAPERLEFEAEAAMRLETAAGRASVRGLYPVGIEDRGAGRPLEIAFGGLIRGAADDVRAGAGAAEVSARFHASLARLVVRVAERAREARGVSEVSLAGGVFLNRRLLTAVEAGLEARGFRVFRPLAYSPSDESISLGQIAWGLARLRNGGT
ncbi:MAG TPA: carbamoyltransferase HypF [Candidatus Aminicenantes bacterium]|nr:carbamoyltransferase HypF [Candidatus Aminicenantes bacterium]HRY64478.1 carbamoyltransferase HypF [Candidatus Aminicenantes bacterium]HRZ71391.1 carbamoyltransferase HypF [Candidatus Aminicenantes bacterium]